MWCERGTNPTRHGPFEKSVGGRTCRTPCHHGSVKRFVVEPAGRERRDNQGHVILVLSIAECRINRHPDEVLFDREVLPEKNFEN